MRSGVVVGVVIGLLVIVALCSLVVIVGGRYETLPMRQLEIGWLRQVLGLFVAGVAALALLLGCLSGTDRERLMGLLIPFFAGMVLLEPGREWAITIPAGTIAIGLVVRNTMLALRGIQQP